jgi:hypothetical protein
VRKTMTAATTGLVCVGLAAAAMLASTAGVNSQTVTPTRTPAVDVPTATDIPAATATATAGATPIAVATAKATPVSRTASEEQNAGDDERGSSTCQKHKTPSHGETGGNHCGQQKHGDHVGAPSSD